MFLPAQLSPIGISIVLSLFCTAENKQKSASGGSKAEVPRLPLPVLFPSSYRALGCGTASAGV